ncbi:hypothetical protein [Leisingera sp. M523]|uniref:hypothetical protein n=1 Tax=Leisingera sp. M523 TaxID=2867013 RepID=UPI0021A59782|nr:hypothetical protein [Leisingera sp. M523]UWQ27703.1 hypothetical protein K3557_12940 [Leisingera sp. M523]
MPLADRDRFELSGADLTRWLTKPEAGADLLCRNLGETREEDTDEDSSGVVGIDVVEQNSDHRAQRSRQSEFNFPSPNIVAGQQTELQRFDLPKIQEVSNNEAAKTGRGDYVTGLGFEDCCEISAKQSIAELKPRKVHCIQYDIEGRSKEILRAAMEANTDVVMHSANEVGFLGSAPFGKGLTIDITGLSKPLIFTSIKTALRRLGEVIVSYTAPDSTWLDSADLDLVHSSNNHAENVSAAEALKEIVACEFPPYHIHSLERLATDATRARALLAFSSSSHERLIHLVSNQSFNHLDVLTSSASVPSAHIAEMVARVAVREAETHDIIKQDDEVPDQILANIERSYHTKYFLGGMNFEIGLTGSKLETLASAAFCSKYRVNNVWYVRPNKFDTNKFTTGAGQQRYFKISI